MSTGPIHLKSTDFWNALMGIAVVLGLNVALALISLVLGVWID